MWPRRNREQKKEGNSVRFSYAEAMCDPSFYLPLAVAAEEAGYHSFVVPDNLGYLGPSEAKYPYLKGGDYGFLEDKRDALRRFADRVMIRV
jgi:hypothetical protein